ncbi:MAG: hypothetical protein ACYSTS_16810 [Planctomycetota bacterium]|jgi:hypothetical protein
MGCKKTIEGTQKSVLESALPGGKIDVLYLSYLKKELLETYKKDA